MQHNYIDIDMQDILGYFKIQVNILILHRLSFRSRMLDFYRDIPIADVQDTKSNIQTNRQVKKSDS